MYVGTKAVLIKTIMYVGFAICGYGLALIPLIHGFILWAVGATIGVTSFWHSFSVDRRFYIDLWRWRFREGKVPDED